MRAESLEEAIRIRDLTGLPMHDLIPEKMIPARGGISEFDNLSEKDKEYFRKRFEEWEAKHCVCVEARKDGAR